MKNISLFIVGCIFSFAANAQLPKVSSGKIIRFEHMKSQFVDARNIDVWLPTNYDSTKKYPVLYMHDGQMLYDSTTTWNKQEWKVDETIAQLINDQKINEFIVVGVWNNNKKRFAEYFPQKALKYLKKHSDTLGMYSRVGNFSLQADNYLKFLVKELKPKIDKSFSTYTNKENTFIAGSSMGGLISMYAICEYPKVFGGAACLSTHWPILYSNNNNPFPKLLQTYVSKKLPSSNQHRIYFDYGTATLDSLYKPHQTVIDSLLKAKGYDENNWVTKEFIGEAHTEKAWANRLNIPIQFLLKK